MHLFSITCYSGASMRKVLKFFATLIVKLTIGIGLLRCDRVDKKTLQRFGTASLIVRDNPVTFLTTQIQGFFVAFDFIAQNH